MTTELYKVHRPTNLQELIGQDDVCKMLSKQIKSGKVPHAMLLQGPSGCGKTTTARIIASQLKCKPNDYKEKNCASDCRGVDDIRGLIKDMRTRPLGGKGYCKIYVLDECHQLTNDAQSALLKPLEDTYSWVYLILCTTHPQKILPTVQTRCTKFTFGALSDDKLEELAKQTFDKEGVKVKKSVISKLIEIADGSARQLMVGIDQIYKLKDPSKQVEALAKMDVKRQAIDLARKFFQRGVRWNEIAEILKDMGDDAETVRWVILGYASKILISGGPMAPRAYAIIQTFRDNLFDSKMAGLAANCYEIFTAK